jgi:glycosyltransferase involved in cell wall biosynthesis
LVEDAFQVGTPALRRAVRQLTGIPAGRRLLLGVFRLAEEKNPHLFVKVAARLLDEFKDLHAVICGGGGLEDDIRADLRRRGIEASFTLLSGIAAMPLIMGGSTLLLHTSRVEGTPNALLEAQAAGLPIVCTRTGGSEDCLSFLARQHAHPQGSTELLVESCRRILSDDTHRRRLARSGRIHVRRSHSIDALVSATLAPFSVP